MNDGEGMIEEAVEPQENVETPMDEIIEQAQPEQIDETQENQEVQEEKPEPKMIPLSVAQKLREKKKELELELQWERQERQRLMQMQQSKTPVPEEKDDSLYESATKEDLRTAQDEAIRVIEERLWIKQNPEKYEEVNELLPKFLKQRPNLASAINQASNRYEEAYTLMKALSPKQQKDLKVAAAQPKKMAPNAPASVPKAAALNEAVDVMGMSDSEFAAWRASKKRQR